MPDAGLGTAWFQSGIGTDRDTAPGSDFVKKRKRKTTAAMAFLKTKVLMTNYGCGISNCFILGVSWENLYWQIGKNRRRPAAR